MFQLLAFFVADFFRSLWVFAFDLWFWGWEMTTEAELVAMAEAAYLDCHFSDLEAEPDSETQILYTKGNQRFVFRFNDRQRWEVMEAAGRMAANPEIDFDWHDVAILRAKVKPWVVPVAEDEAFDFDPTFDFQSQRFTLGASDATNDDL